MSAFSVRLVTDRQELDNLDVPSSTEALVQIVVSETGGEVAEIDLGLDKFRALLKRAGI